MSKEGCVDIKIEVVNNVSSILNKMYIEALETIMGVMGREELNFTTDKSDTPDLMTDDFVDTTYNIQLKEGELLLNKYDRYINRKAERVLMDECGSEEYIPHTIREDFSCYLRHYFADSPRVKIFLKNYGLKYEIPERDKYVVVSHKHILNGDIAYPHIDNLLSIVKKVYSIK